MDGVSHPAWPARLWSALHLGTGTGPETFDLSAAMQLELGRRLRFELIRRQSATCFSYPVLQFGCFWFTPLGQDHGALCLASAAAQLVVAVVRFGLGQWYRRREVESLACYYWICALTLGVGVFWAVFVAYTMSQYGLGWGSIIPLLATGSTLMGSAGPLSPALILGRLFSCTIVSPLFYWWLTSGDPSAAAIGFMAIAGLGSVMVLLNSLHSAIVAGQVAMLKLEHHRNRTERSPGSGSRSDRRQIDVPRQHEPRDSYAAHRRDRSLRIVGRDYP